MRVDGLDELQESQEMLEGDRELLWGAGGGGGGGGGWERDEPHRKPILGILGILGTASHP